MPSFRDIVHLYEESCLRAPLAREQRLLHVNQGYKEAALLLKDDPQVHSFEGTFPTVAGQQWVDVPCSIHSINWITDQSTGLSLKVHPSGSKGMSELMEPTTGIPATGDPVTYVHRADKIYFFPTPVDVRTMRVSFRWNMPEVTDATLDLHPMLAQQWDMTIALLATASYFDLNPPVIEGGQVDYQRSERLRQRAREQIATQAKPGEEDARNIYHWTRPLGYSFDVSC